MLKCSHEVNAFFNGRAYQFGPGDVVKAPPALAAALKARGLAKETRASEKKEAKEEDRND